MLTDDQLTSLAREYAEEVYKGIEDERIRKPMVDSLAKGTEDSFHFLLRRFCLVEKSKVKTKHKEALAALESNDNEDVKWGTYRLSLLKSLFPDLAKEVE